MTTFSELIHGNTRLVEGVNCLEVRVPVIPEQKNGFVITSTDRAFVKPQQSSPEAVPRSHRVPWVELDEETNDGVTSGSLRQQLAAMAGTEFDAVIEDLTNSQGRNATVDQQRGHRFSRPSGRPPKPDDTRRSALGRPASEQGTGRHASGRPAIGPAAGGPSGGGPGSGQ